MPEALLNSRAKLRSWLVTIAVSMASITIGFDATYPSAAIPDINTHRNPFHLTLSEGSWFTSVIIFGALVGGFVGGYLADYFGRKFCMMLNAIPWVSGWMLVAVSTSTPTMYVGRALTGFSTMVNNILVPMYVSEFAPKSMRGRLSAVHSLCMSTGFMVVHISAIGLSWMWMINVNLATFLLCMVLMLAVPESPRWLLVKGYKDGARYTLQWFRCTEDVQEEVDEIQERIGVSPEEIRLVEFGKKQLLKPLLIALGLALFQSICGYEYLQSYILQIFMLASKKIDPILQTLIVGIAGIVGNLGAFFLVDRIGRRLPLIVSGAVMSVCMALLAIYFRLQISNREFLDRHLFWLPVTALFLFVITYNLSWGPIPMLLISEMFPSRARAMANSMSMIVMYFALFVIIKFPPDIQMTSMGTVGVYAIFAIICLLSAIFVFLCVPETKGRTLEDIEKDFEEEDRTQKAI